MDYCTIDNDGNIEQVARGFTECPFENGIEIPNEVATCPDKYLRHNKEWVIRKGQVSTLTIADIDRQVVQKIRERYDENEEFKMLRLGILGAENPEFVAYNDYVEECRAWGQAEKTKIEGVI